MANESQTQRQVKPEDVKIWCPVERCDKEFGDNAKELRVHLEVYHDEHSLAEALTEEVIRRIRLDRAIVRKHGIEPYDYFHDEWNL